MSHLFYTFADYNINLMKKTIYSHFDKKEIAALPVVAFSGRIITIMTAGEAEKAVDYLLSSDILGVDTETRPSFRRGRQYKVALLQVSNRDTCFLFRLNQTGITPAIKRLLEDKTVKKVGLSWHDDIRGLEAREKFEPGLFIELQDMVGDIGIKDLSLQKLYANIFHKKISKRERLTNWEASTLTEKQKRYAAIDAWACIQLYEEILKLENTKDYNLVVVAEPDNQPEPQKMAVASSDNLEKKRKAPIKQKKIEKETRVIDKAI